MEGQWCLGIQNRCCPVIHSEHTEQGYNSAGFSTGSCSLTLKKSQFLSASLFWFHLSLPLSQEKPLSKGYCVVFFSMPGCPVEISSYAFETRVPRSHLVNRILSLLPEPALSGCWWLCCSVVKSLITLPPLQKKCQAGELFWRQSSTLSRRWIFISYLRNAEGAFLVRMTSVFEWNSLPNAKFHCSILQVFGYSKAPPWSMFVPLLV